MAPDDLRKATSEAIVVPHQVNNHSNPYSETIQFFTSEQKQYTWSLPNIRLEAGSVYIFKLALEADEPAEPETRSQGAIVGIMQQAWNN